MPKNFARGPSKSWFNIDCNVLKIVIHTEDWIKISDYFFNELKMEPMSF